MRLRKKDEEREKALQDELHRRAEERRRERQRRLEQRLSLEIRQQAPRNALIWSGVVGGALLLNMLVLLALAR